VYLFAILYLDVSVLLGLLLRVSQKPIDFSDLVIDGCHFLGYSSCLFLELTHFGGEFKVLLSDLKHLALFINDFELASDGLGGVVGLRCGRGVAGQALPVFEEGGEFGGYPCDNFVVLSLLLDLLRLLSDLLGLGPVPLVLCLLLNIAGLLLLIDFDPSPLPCHQGGEIDVLAH